MTEELLARLNPKSKLLIAAGAAVVLIFLAAAFWLERSREADFLPEDKTVESVEKALKSAGTGTLPEVDPLTNPLERAPDVNPVSKANPFSGIKTNPFKK